MVEGIDKRREDIGEVLTGNHPGSAEPNGREVG